jgi:hypothetical protein
MPYNSPEHSTSVTAGTLKHRLALVLVSVLAGALITLYVIRETHPPKRLGTAAETFVPAQTLHFWGSGGLEFAQLPIGSNGSMTLDLTDPTLRPLLQYSVSEDNEAMNLYSEASPGDPKQLQYVTVLMEPEPVFQIEMPGGKYVTEEAQGWERSTTRALAKFVYHTIFPEKPEHTLADTLPTEDIRLVDRDEHLFAVLGSSESGEPGVILVRPNHHVLMALTVTEAGLFSSGPKQWPTVIAFDRQGVARLQIDLGPKPEPVLTIYEKTDPDDSKQLGINYLDPVTGKETPKVHWLVGDEGAIPWLKHDMRPIGLPITLRDQRGQILWKSSSQ